MSAPARAGGFRLAPRQAAVGLAALMVVLIGGLALTSLLIPNQGQFGGAASILAVVLAITVVGLVVAWHQPGNAIGWLLLGGGTWIPLTVLCSAYAEYVYLYHHDDVAGLAFTALIVSQLFTPVIVIFPLVTLLFPGGRLPSPRWRPMPWAYLVLLVGIVVAVIVPLAQASAHHHLMIQTQGAVPASEQPPGWLALIFFGAVGLGWLAAVAHQAASWRRSSGERRQQLKWLLSGTVVCALLGGWAVGTNSSLWQVAILGLIALPASMGVAIMRYRLYDIDRIVSRTVTYALVTGLLVGVYAGLVLLATQVLGSAPSWVVAASTLAVAALFSPVRRRVQRAVDRRFNRARYDADLMAGQFAARLAGAVDLDAVRADLVTLTQQALEPAHVSLWLHGGDQ